MNQKPTLLLLGLLAFGNAHAVCYQLDEEACQRSEEYSKAVQADEQRWKEQQDERKRWQSIQVIEPNNVTTYYPSGDGQSYTGYSLRTR